jgi:hypothetical protein
MVEKEFDFASLLEQKIKATNRTTRAVRALVLFLFIQLAFLTLANIFWQVGLAFPDEDNCNIFGCQPYAFFPISAGVLIVSGVVVASLVGWGELEMSQVPKVAIWPKSPYWALVVDELPDGMSIFEALARFGVSVYFYSFALLVGPAFFSGIIEYGFDSVLDIFWLLMLILVTLAASASGALARNKYNLAMGLSIALAVFALVGVGQDESLDSFIFDWDAFLFGYDAWASYFDFLRFWPIIGLGLVIAGRIYRSRIRKS